jgi:hypothetical protein
MIELLDILKCGYSCKNFLASFTGVKRRYIFGKYILACDLRSASGHGRYIAANIPAKQLRVFVCSYNQKYQSIWRLYESKLIWKDVCECGGIFIISYWCFKWCVCVTFRLVCDIPADAGPWAHMAWQPTFVSWPSVCLIMAFSPLRMPEYETSTNGNSFFLLHAHVYSLWWCCSQWSGLACQEILLTVSDQNKIKL